MIDLERISDPIPMGAGAGNRLVAQLIAGCDEWIAEALSCGNSEQAIEQIRQMGLTKTADRLKLGGALLQLITLQIERIPTTTPTATATATSG